MGISGRHSAHQVAQKFTRTTFPRRSIVEIRRVSMVPPMKWGVAIREAYPTRSSGLRSGAAADSAGAALPGMTASNVHAIRSRSVASQAHHGVRLGAPRTILTSRLSHDRLDIPQNSVAVHDGRDRVGQDPFLADHSLRVDQKERPD